MWVKRAMGVGPAEICGKRYNKLKSLCPDGTSVAVVGSLILIAEAEART